MSRQLIFELAKKHGFDSVGIAKAELTENEKHNLELFISKGLHGSMQWMETRKIERSDPRNLWKDVKTVISLGVNYSPFDDPMKNLQNPDSGVISVYAQGKDYHDVIKKKLKAMARDLVASLKGNLKVFVDTAPVMEKALAAKTAIGWQGKHTCLVSKEYGSWLFLGEIFLDCEIEPDICSQFNCGSCSRCIDICPTNAIIAPGKIDARRCISYLTIELKEQIPHEFRKAIGNRIYGCDDCLAVCPWNKFAKTARETAFHPRNELKAPLLSELAVLSDDSFRKIFSGSPIKRIGRDRFVRNVLVAIGNSQNKSFLPLLSNLKNDSSQLVAEMAEWAATELTNEQNNA